MMLLLLSLLLLTRCGGDSAGGCPQTAQKVIILDVREQDEYDSGHIPGAVLLPTGTIAFLFSSRMVAGVALLSHRISV